MRRIPYGPVRDGWRLTNYSLGLTYNDTELPEDTVGPVASLVGRLGGVPFESRVAV